MSAVAGMAAPRGNISGYNIRNVPNFTPQQMQLFQQLLGGISGGGGLEAGTDWLSKLAGGDEEAFEASEKPTYSAFNKMLGQLGSRYSQLGARDSSSFQQAVSSGAGELAENLGAKRLGIQQNAIERLLNLSQNLLREKPYETYLEEKPDFMKMLGKLLGEGGGAFASSVGSRGGNALLNLIGRLFK